MWVLLVPLLMLGGFWAFVVWDRRRLSTPTPLPSGAKARTPALLRAWPPMLGVAAMLLFLALVELVHPRSPPFTGKLGFLLQGAYDAIGVYGIACVWVALSAMVAVAAWLAWRHGTPLPDQAPAQLHDL